MSGHLLQWVVHFFFGLAVAGFLAPLAGFLAATFFPPVQTLVKKQIYPLMVTALKQNVAPLTPLTDTLALIILSLVTPSPVGSSSSSSSPANYGTETKIFFCNKTLINQE